jgi:hypothetical protein
MPNDTGAALDYRIDDHDTTKRIRYVFTVALAPVSLPDDPVLQRVWLADQVDKLKQTFEGARVGVLAVMEE